MEQKLSRLFQFNAPRQILAGGESLFELPAMVKLLNGTHVLIVTDAYLQKRGLVHETMRLLSAAGLSSVVYDAVTPDPTVANVEEGLTMFKQHACDVIVALGGGSPIDAAKAIAIRATNEGPLHRYAGYHQIPNAGVPLIAVPTTAGTGSEATQVAVITDTERQVKMMMFDNALLPDIAIVDFQLSMSMPPPLTAYVGIDTLTHGLEAYVSKRQNPFSDPFALSCIRLVGQHLVRAYEWPDDGEARQGMATAACHGGLAFSNSSVCLVHGMSRPLGAVYHLAHGLSNAILLPSVVRFSMAGSIDRYATAARAMGVASSETDSFAAAESLAGALAELNKRLQVPRLRDCVDVSLAEFERSVGKMASDALASGSPQNNPVVPSQAEIEQLYLACW